VPVGQVAGERLERVLTVRAVRPVRQQILVLGVGDEEQPEQRRQCLLVDLLEGGLVERPSVPAGERHRERGNGVVVDTLPQPRPQFGGVVAGGVESLGERPPVRERRSGEQQRQIAGAVVRQQREVGLDERLCPPLAPDPDVRPRRVHADLPAPGDDDPGKGLAVGERKRIRHRTRSGEPCRGAVELFSLVEEDGHRPFRLLHA
jgi:hypothetical protein